MGPLLLKGDSSLGHRAGAERQCKEHCCYPRSAIMTADQSGEQLNTTKCKCQNKGLVWHYPRGVCTKNLCFGSSLCQAAGQTSAATWHCLRDYFTKARFVLPGKLRPTKNTTHRTARKILFVGKCGCQRMDYPGKSL